MNDNMNQFRDAIVARLGQGVKMIEGDDRVREQKCLAKINQILGRYDCDMIPEVIISGSQLMTRVTIVAKARVAQGGAQN